MRKKKKKKEQKKEWGQMLPLWLTGVTNSQMAGGKERTGELVSTVIAISRLFQVCVQVASVIKKRHEAII